MKALGMSLFQPFSRSSLRVACLSDTRPSAFLVVYYRMSIRHFYWAAVLLLSLVLAATPCVAKDIARGDPAARLLPGEFASERWDLTARFDSGYLLFAEFLITNIGLGDRNAAVIGHLIEPNGTTHKFRDGRRKAFWSLSPDRLRIEVGASLLDQHDPTHQLKVTKRSLRAELHFRPDGPVAWSDKFVPAGYAIDLLDAAAPIEGTLWAKGMQAPVSVRGMAAITHSWISKIESNLVRRQIEFFSLQGDYSIYLVDLTPPKGSRSRWMVITQQGRITYETQDFELSLDSSTEKSQDYPAPRTLILKSQNIEGQVPLDHVLLRYNPLGDLPQPFRFLVSLKARPQRTWALSPFELSFRPDPHQAPVHIRGTGVTIVSFLNPM